MRSEETDAFVAALDYPMFVVTVAGPGPGAAAQPRQATRSGCLVGFATQCSIDPFRLLVCISKANHTYPLARASSVLGLHALGSEQRELARLFGETTGDELDKFERCEWRPGPEGVPILAGCAAWMVATVRQRIDLGDHVGFVLEPVEVNSRQGATALSFSQISDLQAGHGA
ncbi:MAG TPA: flavin reductase family protein [Micrococcaceae bacterium]|jgi:flavin reductase (DIM6/NTAB) family NADH-FMN oxidoreductase RutF|nr:flavin reductase family protein [Micrococcaceae bacterium]